jgi:hypothetical protein
LSPFKFEPHLIMPLTEQESRYGKPTLVTDHDLDVLLKAMKQSKLCLSEPALFEKLKDLRGEPEAA